MGEGTLADSMLTLVRIRSWLLALLVLQLVGSLIELVLLNHYEDLLQFIPLALIALTLLLLIWHLARPQPATVRAIQVLMGAFVVAGLAGVVLHVQGAAEFQREMDPAQSSWSILQKALRAQAPPALAPGVMLQMGLLGLVYAYRHPAGSPSME
jgi:hypothetical protein